MSTQNPNDGYTDAQILDASGVNGEMYLANEVKTLVLKDFENVKFDFDLQITCLVFNGYPAAYAAMMTVLADRVPHLCLVAKDATGHGYIIQGAGAQYIPVGYTGPLPAAKALTAAPATP